MTSINPLWQGFYSAAKKNQEFYKEAEKILQEIDDLRNLRNWVGAHWNEWAQMLSDSEATTFLNAVLSLRRLVYCETCNHFISRIAQLDGVWSCKKECSRYNRKSANPS